MTAVLAGADSTNLPEAVDVVLIVDAFHHIPNRAAYLTALKAKLKLGGRVAIVDLRKDAPQGPPGWSSASRRINSPRSCVRPGSRWTPRTPFCRSSCS